jgi:hypothetical protein
MITTDDLVRARERMMKWDEEMAISGLLSCGNCLVRLKDGRRLLHFICLAAFADQGKLTMDQVEKNLEMMRQNNE